VRYAHRGQCQICGSDIVVEAEWPLDERGTMELPEPRIHGLAAAFAVLAAIGAVALAWGESTLWGVVPCAVITIVLVFVGATTWPRKEPGDELGAMARQASFDGHALQEGAAREIAAVTSARRPIGCAGLFFGVLLPLVMIRPESPATIAAGLGATGGFVVAWIRRIRRETEASAGRGVPL
jgi:hypothetical protein